VSELGKAIQKMNFRGAVRFNEPMKKHTSFQVGGPADIFCTPVSAADIGPAIRFAEGNNLPLFVLGSGANILVSDLGIRGLVIDMSELRSCTLQDGLLVAGAGMEMSMAAEIAADAGLAGLEFIYSMPGSVGGSVWMNARCYGTSISERLVFAEIIDRNGIVRRESPPADAFDYKVSPFQDKPWVIISAGFALNPGNTDEILKEMEEHKADRTDKGHFSAPSVGSIFKNNREFGEPSGKIIDSLGLRGHTIGGAKISEKHANIIINLGNGSAAEIIELIRYVESKVASTKGYALEREVRLVGDWPEEG
jgi:UDP-N-acetylmuramate dehydrogenase